MPTFGNMPPPPMPPVMIPQQINRTSKKSNVQSNYEVYSQVTAAQPAVVSAKPTIYNSAKAAHAHAHAQTSTPSANMDLLSLQSEVEKKLKKLKNEKVSAELAISQGLVLMNLVFEAILNAYLIHRQS